MARLLTKEQQKTASQVYSLSTNTMNRVTNTSGYRKLSDEQKNKAVSTVYDYYYNIALNEIGVQELNKTGLVGTAIGIDDFAVILAQLSAVEADKDASGKSITGSKKQKIIDYLNRQNLTAVQKYILMGYMGYKNEKGNSEVKSYINSLVIKQRRKSYFVWIFGLCRLKMYPTCTQLFEI